MCIDAKNGMHFQTLNDLIREKPDPVTVNNCCGQRYIGAGLSGREIVVNGTPGNALGAYLNGSRILVNGNAQDAVGDTMNDGEIVVNGNIGDAAGYAMRGGRLYVKGNAGYRAGIHMKEYKDKKPVIVIGGTAGSFLGEYQAGGLIAVLNLNDEQQLVGNFTGTGMHGGKIFLRCETPPARLPAQVTACVASAEDLSELTPHIEAFCKAFGFDAKRILESRFYRITPDSANPYQQLYTPN